MKLFKIAFSNIRKRKSSAITLLAISAVAVLMLSISLSLLFGMGGFYNAKANELNMPHVTFIMANSDWDDGMLTFAQNYADMKEVELNEAYRGDNMKIQYDGKTVKKGVVFGNENAQRTMDIIKPIDTLSIRPDNSILLQLSYKYDGVNAGDTFTIISGSTTYNFIVYGFIEDIQLGHSTSTHISAYVQSDIFNKLSEDNNLLPAKRLSLMLNNPQNAYNFISAFLDDYPLGNNTFYNTRDGAQFAVTMLPFIISMVLILVAVIVVVIALIIARFTIINNIEEDVKTLGALKSLGFTSKQIILSMTLQFLLISLTGAIAGVLIALGLSGIIGNLVSSASGLLWSGASMFLPSALAILFVVGIVAVITYLMARKAKLITPINALRAGLSNHTFVKNIAPLEKTKMPINVNLAIKQFRGNLKNNIAVFIVVILFAFMTVLTSIVYHNFVVDTNAFKQMGGLEPYGILINTNTEQFAVDNFDEIVSRPNADIRKIARVNVETFTYNNISIMCWIWEDMSQRENNTVIEGKAPQEDNEIAIPAGTAKGIGKKIGDRISLKFGDTTYNYLITGFTQGVNNAALMTAQGFSNLKENAVLKWLAIYFNNPYNSDFDFLNAFANSLIDDYGRNNINFEISTEYIDDMLASIATPIGLAAYFIAAVTIFIICFVLFLITNTLIRRRKKDSGIMKALGFTSGQLILQMLLSFLPAILGGVLIGSILGITLTNPLLGLMFGGLGIAKAAFAIPALLTVIAEILLAGVCISTICLVSLKLKNIAPQKLIVES